MTAMGYIMLKGGRPNPLAPGEKVLCERWLPACTSTSLPSYRIAFYIPMICDMYLRVTDRRFMFYAKVFYFLTQELWAWYPGQNPPDDPEVIKSVSIQKGLFGRCLDIRSHNPTRERGWYWSPKLTLRFFLPRPEEVEKIIVQAMNRGAKGK